MNSKKFIEAIKIAVKKDTVSSVVETMVSPPGRKPANELVELSEWYNKQNEEARMMIKKIILYSVDSSIFHFLCVLDGVSAIESTEDKGELELRYINDKQNILLNDKENNYLHDIYNAE